LLPASLIYWELVIECAVSGVFLAHLPSAIDNSEESRCDIEGKNAPLAVIEADALEVSGLAVPGAGRKGGYRMPCGRTFIQPTRR
jgi:hypothetical protein